MSLEYGRTYTHPEIGPFEVVRSVALDESRAELLAGRRLEIVHDSIEALLKRNLGEEIASTYTLPSPNSGVDRDEQKAKQADSQEDGRIMLVQARHPRKNPYAPDSVDDIFAVGYAKFEDHRINPRASREGSPSLNFLEFRGIHVSPQMQGYGAALAVADFMTLIAIDLQSAWMPTGVRDYVDVNPRAKEVYKELGYGQRGHDLKAQFCGKSALLGRFDGLSCGHLRQALVDANDYHGKQAKRAWIADSRPIAYDA